LVRVLPPDNIPAIDEPAFVGVGEAAGWLDDREPVVSVGVGGDARAYPVQILTWHEIVNDEIGGRPVAVTYCPLCNSAVAFERDLGGRVLEFGTSGQLYESALVMYDRPTQSLWTHFTGQAISGELKGTTLQVIPAQMLSFGEWRTLHPDGLVLSRGTGFERPYGENPYEGYDRGGPYDSFVSGEADDRLPAIARVVGVETDGEAVAYPYSSLRAERGASVLHDTVAGRRIAVLWKAGVASAHDAREIRAGRDVGSSGVFVASVNGRSLTFAAAGGRIEDGETGSEWSLSGRAVSGPLAGTQLEPVAHLDTFWFAWAAYHPGTEVL
ncbi:MAG TPA: DUF3179 domain-containing protein, partial [Actinomycetota bacterium]|nr:DUF3179 domain-containing protein [Actinomycetota bacterium]